MKRAPEHDHGYLLAELPEAVIVSNSETEVLYANRAAEDILRLSRAELIASPLKERVHPDDHAQVREYAASLKHANHLVTRRRFLRGDSEYIYIERNTRLLSDDTQLSVCRDVSDEVAHEVQQNTFISLAAHELRSPLSSIKIHAELLAMLIKDTAEHAQAVQLLADIHDEIERESRLIGDLLDISRMKEGKLSLHIQGVELGALLNETVSQIRASTGRTFTLSTPPSPAVVLGDQDRLYQVFMNLFTNAVKYSSEPAPVEVTLLQKGDTWHIAVKDYGIGMSHESQGNIFKRFFQVTPTLSPGLGIGLYLVSEIVDGHGGYLEVESAPGAGSTFTVVLPATGHLPTNISLW